MAATFTGTDGVEYNVPLELQGDPVNPSPSDFVLASAAQSSADTIIADRFANGLTSTDIGALKEIFAFVSARASAGFTTYTHAGRLSAIASEFLAAAGYAIRVERTTAVVEGVSTTIISTIIDW